MKATKMQKHKIQVRRHGSGVWREVVVLNNLRGQLYVDFNGAFDWVCAATHEIVSPGKQNN